MHRLAKLFAPDDSMLLYEIAAQEQQAKQHELRQPSKALCRNWSPYTRTASM